MNRLTLTLLLTLFTAFACAQSVEELQRQIRQAEEEIRLTNNLLNQTKQERTANQNQLKLVRNNIGNRRRIVSNLDRQIGMINRDVGDKHRTVERLQAELDALKTEYASMIRNAYRNYRLNNIMTFLFASRDFRDAARRIYYVRRYTLIRERKAAQIDSITHRLTGDIRLLQTRKDSLDRTVRARNAELQKLSAEEREYRRIDASLGSRTRKYTRELAEKRNTINKLQQRIRQIIAEESKRSSTQKRTTAETEAFEKLSGRFDQNQGRLPYPVTGGVIVDRYGKHPHPTQKGLTINNTGVNIAAEKGAPVRAVFDGEVVRVFFYQRLNNSVMIRHGNYITVYSNLETVGVRAGDRVSGNQVIGTTYAGDDPDNRFLHFEIWKETRNLNPEQWLKR